MDSSLQYKFNIVPQREKKKKLNELIISLSEVILDRFDALHSQLSNHLSP